MKILSQSAAIALFGASLLACGGGGGGGGGDTPQPSNSPAPTATPGGGNSANNSVQEVLDDLGIDTTASARVDNDGDALPDDFAPMGSAMAINKYREVMLFGVPLEDAGVVDNSVTQNQMTLTNLIPGSNNSYNWEVLHDASANSTTWMNLQAKRRAVVADIDGDGLDETVVVYQDDGDVELVIQQDAAQNFALSNPVAVDNGSYSALFIGAGDFDGDGDADLALGMINANGDAQLKMLQNEAGAFSFNGLSLSLPKSTYNIAHMVIEAGNLDYDRAEELAVLVNAGNLTSTNNALSGAEHRYLIVDDAGTQFSTLESGQIEYDNGNGTQRAVFGNLALGDVDGDSLDEVVLAGLNQIGGVNSNAPVSSFRHAIQVLDDAKQNFSLLAAGSAPAVLQDAELPPNGEHYNEGSGTQQAINYVALVTADVDGDGAAEFLVNQRLFQSLRSTPDTLTLYDDDDDAENGPSTIASLYWYAFDREDNFNFNWRSVAVAAGDVTLDGRDNIVMYSQREAGTINEYQALMVWGHDQVNGWSLIKEIRTDKRFSIGGSPNYHPQVLLPDSELDDGTVAIKYSEGSHQLVFTQPLLIAALAGAPCAEDLGQNLNDSCRTAFGRAVSSGTTSTQSTTVTGRLFAGFGAGAPVSNNSLEVTASISKTINRWTSTAYSLRTSLVYETGPLEDSVILTVVPIDVYTYTLLRHPDPTLVGEEVHINLSRDPITALVTLEYYNQIVDQASLRIGSDVFDHSRGDVTSYPSRADKNALLNRYTGLQSTEASVGQGGGQTTATIEEFNSTSTGVDYQTAWSLDVRATGGAGAYVIGGFSVGSGSGDALETTHGSETIYQGAVANISQAAFDAGEDYNWGLFAYIYNEHSSGQSFEVLNYWVEN